MLLVRKSGWAALGLVALTALVSVSRADDTSSDAGWLLGNAEMVMKFNIKQLMASELMKKYGIDAIKKGIESNEEVSKTVKAMDLDVTKDIDAIILSASGSNPEDAKGMIVITGRFDTNKVTESLKKRSADSDEIKVIQEGGQQLFEFKMQDRSLVGGFAGRNAMVLTQSKEETLKAIKAGGKKPAEMTKLMKGAQSRFSGNESMTMSLVIGEELKKMLAASPRGGEAASNLETLTASVTVTDTVALNLTGYTVDAKSAAQLSKLLEGLKSTGSLLLGGMEGIPPVVTDMIDAIKIDSKDKTIRVNLLIDKEMLNKISKIRP
jgi:hypothetical protein